MRQTRLLPRYEFYLPLRARIHNDLSRRCEIPPGGYGASTVKGYYHELCSNRDYSAAPRLQEDFGARILALQDLSLSGLPELIVMTFSEGGAMHRTLVGDLEELRVLLVAQRPL